MANILICNTIKYFVKKKNVLSAAPQLKKQNRVGRFFRSRFYKDIFWEGYFNVAITFSMVSPSKDTSL
jgi:hypothetical protein